MAFCWMAIEAQSISLDTKNLTGQRLLLSKKSVVLGSGDFTTVAVAANCDYTVTTDADWLTARRMANGNTILFGALNFNVGERKATVTFTSADGSVVKKISVVQEGEDFTDTYLSIASGTASSSQGGEGIEKSFDGDFSTLYHSPYGSQGQFPITLTYQLRTPSHVDYAVYTPRQDGNPNGNFQVVDVSYQIDGASSWTTLGTFDFEGRSSSSNVDFGANGVDNIKAVRFVVKSGQNGFAACSEMAFYKRNDTMSELIGLYFADALCTQLRPGMTAEEIEQIPIDELKEVAKQMLAGTYSMEFRVGAFDAVRDLVGLRDELRNSHTYNNHENPTGITFTEGETVLVVAEGIGDQPVSLLVRNFGPQVFAASSYSLKNGLNVLKMQNRGNGYVSYYTPNYKKAPTVKLHFLNGKEQGYFSPKYKGHTNDDWKRLLKNAKGDCLDMHGEYIDCVFPVSSFKANCPSDGEWLMNAYDNVVYKERELMGVFKYNHDVPNRQCAITVASSGGLYHASNDGFCVPVNALRDPTSNQYYDYWGVGHELGHNNQTRGFVWTGLTEVTNNVMSAWVQHELGNGYHRLEDEAWNGPRGERIQAYLQYGVCEGNAWQLQPGPNSYGTTFEKVDVADQDENGNTLGMVTTTEYAHDVFVKLVPLWQLLLWTEDAGMSPDAYKKLYEGLRHYNGNEWANGQQQIRFMKLFCDSTKINFLPFFEKAGMLKAAKFYQNDYSNGWIVITQKMVDDLKSYIAGKNYEEAPAGLNYLTAYNVDRFKNKTKLTAGTVGAGCTKSGNRVRVENAKWPGAVGYETYDASGNHIASTVFGYADANQSTTYTYVQWPSKASYIMAVGYDGTRVKCYE